MAFVDPDLDVFSAWEEGDSQVFRQLQSQFGDWEAQLKAELDSGLASAEFKKVQSLYRAVGAARELCFKRQ